ncbi:MAG: hypothetical protein U5S82_13185 [Gammaproteobacteria bacterium]|nr:hypothetical protein [Gammaproteobacteria bacterium]
MSEETEDRQTGNRAATRRHWPVKRTTLEDQDTTADLRDLAPEERVGMMWRLALDAWLLSGRAIPQYRRADAPGRVLRLNTSDGPASDLD